LFLSSGALRAQTAGDVRLTKIPGGVPTRRLGAQAGLAAERNKTIDIARN
jgi:hypothetical protein